jgi:hypothetical protein
VIFIIDGCKQLRGERDRVLRKNKLLDKIDINYHETSKTTLLFLIAAV